MQRPLRAAAQRFPDDGGINLNIVERLEASSVTNLVSRWDLCSGQIHNQQLIDFPPGASHAFLFGRKLAGIDNDLNTRSDALGPTEFRRRAPRVTFTSAFICGGDSLISQRRFQQLINCFCWERALRWLPCLPFSRRGGPSASPLRW